MDCFDGNVLFGYGRYTILFIFNVMNITQADLVQEIRNGNKMAIRFHVAKAIAEYLNKCTGKILLIDKEIRMQCDPLFKELERGESVTTIVDRWRAKALS